MVSEKRLRELAEAEEPRAALQALGGGGAPGSGALRQGQEGVAEVLLIRHAQMPALPDPREDRPLTDIGREQAEALGAFLAREPLHAVYSSPTMRTRETAAAVAKPHGLTVGIIDDLRDVEFYVPEGQTWEQFTNENDFKERAQRFQRERRWDVYAPFYEQSDVLRQRIRNVVDQVVGRHPGQRIALRHSRTDYQRLRRQSHAVVSGYDRQDQPHRRHRRSGEGRPARAAHRQQHRSFRYALRENGTV